MTDDEAVELLTKEKEIQALDDRAYVLFLVVGLRLLHDGVYPIAKVLPPPPRARRK